MVRVTKEKETNESDGFPLVRLPWEDRARKSIMYSDLLLPFVYASSKGFGVFFTFFHTDTRGVFKVIESLL